MKTTHWILLGAAAVAAFYLWKQSQKNEPLKLDDIGETSEFSGGGGGARRTAVMVRTRSNATSNKRRK